MKRIGIVKDDLFISICKSLKLNPPVKEYQFCKDRKWRIDYSWVELKLAVEIEGGLYSFGRHTRAGGYIKDMEKYNRLTEEGWSLLRYPYSKDCKKVDWEQVERMYWLHKAVEERMKN